jgi:two-component system OmpR family sensor kinase
MRRISRWLPASLRWRLTFWVAGVMLVSAAVIFVVVYKDTKTRLLAQIDHDVSGDTGQLADLVASLRNRSPRQVARAVDLYLAAQPYSTSSTLLFVVVKGQATASNHPELFGIPHLDNGETEVQQQQENELGRRLLQPRPGFSTQPVPDAGKMRIHERLVPFVGAGVLVGAGEPLSTVDRAQRGLVQAFVLAGALTLGLALIASYLAGARVSSPLGRMAAVAARVDAGDLEPRMPSPIASGSEVQVLAEAFNHMLDRLEDAFRGQREFVADASHELRTPLTVMRGQLEVLAAQAEPSPDEVKRAERVVQAEITRVSRLVDDLLLLAQAEQRDFLSVEPIDLHPFLTELWDGLSLTADRRFELGSVPAATLRADPDRLAQALRNLAGNAIAHTTTGSGLVRLEVAPLTLGRVRFSVIDNGPGISPQERQHVFERFHRVDRARSRRDGGAGLGLAIVRAIADAHGGTVRVAEPPDGRGALIELDLPGLALR